jgi:hypothetical protein
VLALKCITLKGSNDGALHLVLLFLWTWPIVQYSKRKPLRFGSWLCRHLQVKMPTGLEYTLQRSCLNDDNNDRGLPLLAY